MKWVFLDNNNVSILEYNQATEEENIPDEIKEKVAKIYDKEVISLSIELREGSTKVEDIIDFGDIDFDLIKQMTLKFK